MSDEPVNVKDFGAIGDGEADDTDAINAALKYAEEHGRPVRFPSGDYRVRSLKEPDGA